MPDRFTKVTKTGWGTRLGGSLKGVLVGILLFVASFYVLFWNEGLVDSSEKAETAIEIQATETADVEAQGELVSVSGTLTTEEKLGDELYLIPGDYLAVERVVEMFAWTENTSSTSETKWGGSEETTTETTYVTEWTQNPYKTSDFEHPEDHENPSKSLDGASYLVGSAKIGNYDLDVSKLSLPSSTKLTLNEEVIDLSRVDVGVDVSPDVEEEEVPEDDVYSSEWVISADDEVVEEETKVADVKSGVNISGEYLFIGKGSLSSPEVGDIRISYRVLQNNISGSLLGKLDGDKITTYVDSDSGDKFYRMFTGTKDEAVSQLHGEYKMKLWVFRVIGFLMMWIGLSSLFAPISVLLDVAPILGSLTRSVIGFITFFVALVLSIVTIVVSMILHSWIAILAVAVIGVGVFFAILKMKGKKAKPA